MEGGKYSSISTIFEDGYKSPSSIIILDNIEKLIEYIKIGPRFSNLILQTILVYIKKLPPKKGKKVLITAGPTYEKLDSVRFIGNFSSGKMGYALAEVCAERGATVELVSGPVSLKAQHPSIHVTSVVSAAEMFEASARLFEDSDAAILCAAVADFTPETCADHKIKREGSGGMTLQLVPTKDIAAELGKRKKDSQLLVGFALETDHEMQNAEGKLERKNLDMIALNSLRDKGAGFGTDTNKVTLIERNGETTSLPLLSKRETAEAIIDRMSNLLPC